MIKPFVTVLFCLITSAVSAQNYDSKVSRDSMSVLQTRLDVLKGAIKLTELKISEAELEADIEKQKLKVVTLNGSEKAAKDESSRLSEALKMGKETDLKKVEKMSKRAENSAKDVKNALGKLSRQIDRIHELRTEIQSEERKLDNRNPLIKYFKN